ncbi:MAG: alanine racemase [Mycobacteriales bacterium]
MARVDLDAIRDNVAALRERSAGAQLMAVVKADGYGHGMLPSARAALAGGANWLGVAFLEEALALREAGLAVPVLAWLFAPAEDLAPAVAADVDLGIYSLAELDRAQAAARQVGRTARLHLKADTGLSRGGATPDAWPELCEAAAKAEADGSVEVRGVWSHFASAEAGPAFVTNRQQVATFEQALGVAAAKGLRPEVRHLANSAALLTDPGTHYDLVRPGAAIYGLSPAPAFGTPAELGLRPAMSLRAQVALTKRVPAGSGVSYGHRYTTTAETTLALVPLGYADGIPRAATNAAPVLVGGRVRTVAGTVAMDQLVVDVGDDDVRPGDEVVLFGEHPTAQDWAAAVGTIDYEIVTRIGPRVPRAYVGELA